MERCPRTRSEFDLAIQLQDEVRLTVVLRGPRPPLGALAVVLVGPGGGLALVVRLRAGRRYPPRGASTASVLPTASSLIGRPRKSRWIRATTSADRRTLDRSSSDTARRAARWAARRKATSAAARWSLSTCLSAARRSALISCIARPPWTPSPRRKSLSAPRPREPVCSPRLLSRPEPYTASFACQGRMAQRLGSSEQGRAALPHAGRWLLVVGCAGKGGYLRSRYASRSSTRRWT